MMPIGPMILVIDVPPLGFLFFLKILLYIGVARNKPWQLALALMMNIVLLLILLLRYCGFVSFLLI